MRMMVKLKQESYPVVIERGILHCIYDEVSKVFSGRKIMIISDDHVFPLYGHIVKNQLKCYEVYTIVVKNGEASKSFDSLPFLYEQLTRVHLSRSDVIIALGGGVVGDLAGFVASTYLRGIGLIHIPTSLLSQVDSCIGGKVAIDLPQGKNLVGAFKQPLLVVVDPDVLKTLDHRFICDGMGEVIKYACILDLNLFNMLKSYSGYDDLFLYIDEIIARCISLKVSIIQQDVYDLGCRLCLNFGHTLGHALEQYYHYERYSHGEAVAIGMAQMAYIGELKGLSEIGTYNAVCELLKQYELPIVAHVLVKDIQNSMMLDKKNRDDHLSYVILNKIGDYSIYRDDIHFVECIKEV